MRSMRVKKTLLAFLAIALSTFSSFQMVPMIHVNALGTVLSVEPPSTTAALGETFQVDINITDIFNLYGYEFQLYYDTNVLSAIDIAPHLGTTNEPGFFFSQYKIWKWEVNDDPYGNGTGYAWLSVTLPFGSPEGLSGSGRLATVMFSADALGTSTLTFQIHNLGDPGSIPIDHVVMEGDVTVTAALSLEPDRGPVGTKATVLGSGFFAFDQGELYFDDQLISGRLATDDQGQFNATFNVPISAPGPHEVKVFFLFLNDFVNKTFTVVDTTPLDINVDVGEIHFRGEKAEFYIQTVFEGIVVDVPVDSLNAILHAPDGTAQALVIQRISTGLYKAPYDIPADATAGTYVLVVEGEYMSDNVDSKGAASEALLLSPTLTNWNAWLMDVNNNVGIIKTDTQIIMLNLTEVKAEIIDIQDTVMKINSTVGIIKADVSNINAEITTIDGTLATVETTVQTLSGVVTSISDNVATVKTDVGTIKGILEDWAGGATTSVPTSDGTFKILTLTTSAFVGSPTLSDYTLTLTLNGDTGTAGRTNIILPKKLLEGIGSSIGKVSVTINDKAVEYTPIESSGAYVMKLAYTHSTVTMKVYLTGIPAAPLPWPTIIAAVIVGALAISIAVLMLKRRKPQTTPPEEATVAN